MRKCIICWKTGAKYDLTKSDKAFQSIQEETDRIQKDLVRMQGEVQRLMAELQTEKAKPKKVRVVEAEGALTQDQIRQLIRLTHPDRHGNSELSNEMTRWLLSLRKKG
jgi:hypothetical protein